MSVEQRGYDREMIGLPQAHQRGYDRAIHDVVEWLRSEAGLTLVADAVELGFAPETSPEGIASESRPPQGAKDSEPYPDAPSGEGRCPAVPRRVAGRDG